MAFSYFSALLISLKITSGNKVIISCRNLTSAWQHKHMSGSAFRHITKSSSAAGRTRRRLDTTSTCPWTRMNMCLCCQADVQCVLQLMMTLSLVKSYTSFIVKNTVKSLANNIFELTYQAIINAKRHNLVQISKFFKKRNFTL